MGKGGSKFGISTSIVLFNCICYLLLSIANKKFDENAIVFGAVSIASIMVFNIVSNTFIKNGDFAIINGVSFLVSVGLVVQYRLDGITAFKQLLWFVIGVVFFFIAFAIVKNYKKLENYYIFYGAISILLLVLTLVIGKELNGSKNWIIIGGVSIQPSELVKLTLIMFMASTLNKKRNFIEILFPISVIAVCMAIFVLQKDLGSSLLIFLVTISMVFISTSNVLYVLVGFSFASVGAYISYLLFDHVRIRVEAWSAPFADPTNKGYQIVQSLFAISAGGWLGTGLKLGHPYLIPIVESDFVFAAICEEFGIVMGLVLILILLIIVYRGLKIARDSSDIFYGLLAAGCSLILAFQTFIIIGGVIKLIPLTGVTLPFISHGGSSMLINMVFIGVLEAIYVNLVEEQ